MIEEKDSGKRFGLKVEFEGYELRVRSVEYLN